MPLGVSLVSQQGALSTGATTATFTTAYYLVRHSPMVGSMLPWPCAAGLGIHATTSCTPRCSQEGLQGGRLQRQWMAS
eukprot:2884992-Pyramimonas_sp.AAC.1